MGNLYKRLGEAWLASGVSVCEGALLDSINRLEKTHAVKLPGQFRDYLLKLGGMTDGQTDDCLISFLSLEAINNELDTKPQNSNIVDITFAEYLIYSHCYVLRISEIGNQLGVYAMDGANEKKIADSFDQFIIAYLENPECIAYCW